MNQIKKKTKSVLQIIILTTSLITTNQVIAKIYKWTTPNGSLNYSDIPPQNANKSELIEIDHLHNKQETKKLIQKTSQDGSKKKISLITKKLKTEKEKNNAHKSNAKSHEHKITIANKNCKIAKHNLESLEISQIILDKNKKLRKLTNNQHQQIVNKTMSQIESYCWSDAKPL
jgi:hypothetical protein